MRVARPAAARALALALALAALAIGGCGGKSKNSSSSSGGSSSGGGGGGGGKATVAIAVSPARTSNHGRPLHALVRVVTLKQFAEDQYASVAQLVVNPDESVLASFVVFPGVEQSVQLERPAKGALAVYFLFTGATGTSWKQLYDPPPGKIQLELGDDQILRPGSTSSSKKRK